MDIKITIDVTPKLADLAERVCNSLERKALFIPARDDDPGYAMLDSLFPRSKASDLPVETPEPAPVSKPVEPPKGEPDAKIEAPAAVIDETPMPDPKDETPVEAPKPKRSHHKKVEKPAAPEPQPEPEKPAEPEPVESSADTNAAPEMSLDEVRAVCVQAAKAGKTKVVTDFLGAHNAQSLSKLDSKHYAELAKIVKAAL